MILRCLTLYLLLSVPSLLWGQYLMGNAMVNDCEGELSDTNAGDVPDCYGHNENLTFTICIEQAASITFTIPEFCTEAFFDYMRVFDGPDTLSPLIGGPYSGSLTNISVTALSGCMTINFISDANVFCIGWLGSWTSEIIPPEPPSLLPLANVPCGSDQVIITLDKPMPCSTLTTDYVLTSGPAGIPLAQVIPLNCVNGFTTTILLIWEEPLNTGGDYGIILEGEQQDACQQDYPFSAGTSFSIVDCPLDVTLQAPPFCQGQCTQISALATGGDPGSYTYLWSPPAPNAAIITVCPDTPAIYIVTVMDGVGSLPASDTMLLIPYPKPSIGEDITICQTAEPVTLSTSIPGGSWSGTGIVPGQGSTWDPRRLGNNLSDRVIYTDPNGCSDTLNVTILPLDAGPDEAACPGSSPFPLAAALPPGGSWSGPGTTPQGLFNPAASGTYLLEYTHPNGCSGTKTVFVDNLSLPPTDSFCSSDPITQLGATPPSGWWTGAGISNSGAFDPAAAGAGQHTLVYQVNGCADSVSMWVRHTDAGPDLIICPDLGIVILPPPWTAGGIWSGLGIIDPVQGLFDPSIPANGANITLTLLADGCSDTRLARIRRTSIGLDTLRLCSNHDPLELRWESVQNVPGNGSWQGPGTYPGGNRWYINPAQAGAGLHQLHYTANGCADSMWLEINQPPTFLPDTFCISGIPALLSASPAPVSWSGTGIVDPASGWFDPAIAGAGAHLITATSAEGCSTSTPLVVLPLDTPQLAPLASIYCYRDTLIPLEIDPGPGFVLNQGVPGPPWFNPRILGEGLHTLTYAGSSRCSAERTTTVRVGPPVTVTMPFNSDTLCFGQGRQIYAEGGGGTYPGQYTYTWNNGLGNGQYHLPSPAIPTTYVVSVTDGCSDFAVDSLRLFILPEIELHFSTGPQVCYGDSTVATVYATPPGTYQFTWLTNPPQSGPVAWSRFGTLPLIATNETTGCQSSGEIRLPVYDPIVAYFSLNPRDSCISMLDPTIQIIDLSSGGTSGYWDFGDGSPILTWDPNHPVAHTFRDTGHFTLTLTIRNEGGCVSRHQERICVEAATTLWFPNALSANADGRNDYFKLTGLGITEIYWYIFDRWGNQLFEGRSLDDYWDGSYKGKPLPQGAYLFMAKYQSHFEKGWKEASGPVILLR